ncbi:YifB family Mg chelatase-like AAA ATPase [Patescibacteria group bacterium]|nr:YifB family Mg chelatase-like AAA ATPase [Patescibacteria group bacterium]
MSSKIFSAALVGLDAEIVEVEADTGGGEMGSFSIVGLPDTSVSESRERVRYAIKNSGLNFPKLKVGVNLAPADLRKQGPSYDLPIAISVLLASCAIKCSDVNFNKILFVGELALSGLLRGVNGILPIALEAAQKGFEIIIVPAINASEAKLVESLEVIPVNSLRQVIDYLEVTEKIVPAERTIFDFSNAEILQDMSHVKGQEQVKRALEISAAGAHNIAMSGPPGSGKTILAHTIPSILPDLMLEEALEVTKIYSVAGKLGRDQALITARPYRAPHHTASSSALIGGGSWPKPGEISLAHRGVLFLDEFAEFPRKILENLRQPLEDGIIHVNRVAGNLIFPAKFILVAAMNPCPCGFMSDPGRECTCTPIQAINYSKKISGPIIDRIDLHVEVPRVNYEQLTSSTESGETSSVIKERVTRTRNIQHERFKQTPFFTNSEMSSEAVRKFCVLDSAGEQMIRRAVTQMHLSARSYFRVLKLARTIADLDQEKNILINHIAEALQYRPKID